MNLLTNAIKFTQDGKIKLNCTFSYPYNGKILLKVAVKDTGIGIPKDKINEVFKEFSQIENGARLNPNGIGLGLYICKRVIDFYGGQIYVSRSILIDEDPRNHGTTFVFTMMVDD